MPNYLAKTSIAVQLKLQASQNYCTELLCNFVNADISETTSMAETFRKVEMLQKITQQHIKCYTSSNYKHVRITTQNSLVTTYVRM